MLHEKHPTVRLLVIGQGPERQRLERLAKELGVADRVDFRRVRRSPRRGAFHRRRGRGVTCSASEVEGFGIALVEAMALGVPYVVSDIPAFREVSGGGIGGALAAPGDPSAFAAALQRLLDRPEHRCRRPAGDRPRAAIHLVGCSPVEQIEVLESTVAQRQAARR